jgi:hypothetical protein
VKIREEIEKPDEAIWKTNIKSDDNIKNSKMAHDETVWTDLSGLGQGHW